MSFAGNLGPAMDGGMRPRTEAAEDHDAERVAADLAAAEASIDGASNVGAGWTGPASHRPRRSTDQPAAAPDYGDYDSQMLEQGDASGEENATDPVATQSSASVRQRADLPSDTDDEDELELRERGQAAAAPEQKRRNAWSRVYLFALAMNMADFVDREQRPVYT